MEYNIHINTIGIIHARNHEFFIELNEKYRPGLKNINGFTHLQVVWWGNLFDKPEYRSVLISEKPYKKGPDKLGIFATRSQIRPNPVLITTLFVQEIDFDKGIIRTPYLDAEDDTPVLDIKPYHFIERVKECNVPEWCRYWPEWYEDSANFNWQSVFNF